MLCVEKTLILPMAVLPMLPSVALADEPERPNVVLIYADDLGYGDVGCYGAQGVATPNIDALCKSGFRCANAYATASTSTPSRYSLLTGVYAWRREGTDVAAGNAATIIKPNEPTVADVFKSAGYRTAVFGKWHLGLGAVTGAQNWNERISPSPADLGFDEHYIMAATADRVPCVFIENEVVAVSIPKRTPSTCRATFPLTQSSAGYLTATLCSASFPE